MSLLGLGHVGPLRPTQSLPVGRGDLIAQPLRASAPYRQLLDLQSQELNSLFTPASRPR